MEPLLADSNDGRTRLQRAFDRGNRFAEDMIEADVKKRRGGETDAAAAASAESFPTSSSSSASNG